MRMVKDEGSIVHLTCHGLSTTRRQPLPTGAATACPQSAILGSGRMRGSPSRTTEKEGRMQSTPIVPNIMKGHPRKRSPA